jgi:hypothetical protein
MVPAPVTVASAAFGEQLTVAKWMLCNLTGVAGP